MAPTPARAVAHIGITVPDIDRAVEWYENLFGFRLIAPPGEVKVEEGGHFADLVTELLGARIQVMRQAHLSTANGAVIELFEFVDPPVEKPAEHFAWWRTGIWHFCVVDPDVDGLANRIAISGGKRRTPTMTIFEGSPYEVAYCEDPFGTVIEIYSHNHEQIYANHVPLSTV